MVYMVPPYRIYTKATRRRKCSLGVADSLSGVVSATVKDKSTGDTKLLVLPYGVELDLSETPLEMAGCFAGDFLSDMIDNFF